MRTKCVSQRRKGRLAVRSFERNAKPRTQEDRQMYIAVSGAILRMAVGSGATDVGQRQSACLTCTLEKERFPLAIGMRASRTITETEQRVC